MVDISKIMSKMKLWKYGPRTGAVKTLLRSNLFFISIILSVTIQGFDPQPVKISYDSFRSATVVNCLLIDHFLMVADHYTWITILGCLDHIVYIVRCFIVLFQSSTGHYTWTGHAAVKGGWPPKRLVDLTRPIAYNALNLFGAVYCSSKQIPIVTHFQRYTETYGIR